MKKYLRLEQISLSINLENDKLLPKVANILKLKIEDITSFKIIKKSIDSRDKNDIVFVFCVDVIFAWMEAFLNNRKNENIIKRHKIRFVDEYEYLLPFKKTLPYRPVLVWTWPSSLFAGLILAYSWLKPIFIERWEEMSDRIKTVEIHSKTGDLKTESNIQFWEWWAWTFSDGKLYTLVNDPRSKFIFETLVECWAPEEILYDAKPHIWTDILRIVIKNLREKMKKMWCEFRFSTKLTDIFIKDNVIDAIEINWNEIIPTQKLILWLGHSARDTFEMLYEKWLQMTQKPFAMWVRIEHSRLMIDKSQYGKCYLENTLPTASYKLVSHNENTRSLYTFCMCPGGYVMPSSSEKDMLCVNGMSEYSQDWANSNSALLVSVLPEDFWSEHPLAWVEFQRTWEKKAFTLWWGKYFAPVQLVWDFLNNKVSTKFWSITPSYTPGTTFANLRECLPEFIIKWLEKWLLDMDKKIKGFANPDAILTWIEARSSSPIRIYRNEFFESNIAWIYPIWEWAWYAGWITSSAIDWVKVGESIVERL